MRSPYFKTNVTSGFTDEALNEIFGSLIVVVAVVVVVARLHRSGIGISDIFSAIKKPVAGFSAPTDPTRHVGRKTILLTKTWSARTQCTLNGQERKRKKVRKNIKERTREEKREND